MRTAMIVETSSSANMTHTTTLCLPVKYGPVMRQNWRPHSVTFPTRTRAMSKHGAAIANATSTQTVELRSSWLQSIDDLKVPVFTLRHLPPRRSQPAAKLPQVGRGRGRHACTEGRGQVSHQVVGADSG